MKIARTERFFAIAGLESAAKNVEGALQFVCAHAADADVIVTRNVKDFEHSPVRALTPERVPRRNRMLLKHHLSIAKHALPA